MIVHNMIVPKIVLEMVNALALINAHVNQDLQEKIALHSLVQIIVLKKVLALDQINALVVQDLKVLIVPNLTVLHLVQEMENAQDL